MSNILDELGLSKPNPESQPNPTKVQIPKKPAAVGKGSEYGVVEKLSPDGHEIVAAFLTTILNPQLCSDADREAAARALMSATGRKLAVRIDDIFKYTFAFMGVSIPVLMLLKVMFPVRGNAYLNLAPGLVIGTSLVAFGLTLRYRRQPDITIVILCALTGFMISIGIVSLI